MGIKITNLPSTTVKDTDYIPVANTSDGTRKVLMDDVLNAAKVDVDSTLDITSSKPVQNKVVTAAINTNTADIAGLKSAIDLGSITPEVKTALLACFENVAWVNEDGQDYVDALHDALYNRYWEVTNNLTNCTTSNESVQTIKGAAYTATITASTGYVMTGATVSITMGGVDITATAYSNGTITIAAVTGALIITISAAAKTVSSISAVYTQSGTVYDTDNLDSLKDDLVVTATYTDSSTETVPAADYTLSGSLTEGTSIITVSYGGKTTTFSVTVTGWVPSEYQKVEYLESTGSEYIDTGIYGDQTTTAEIDMLRLSARSVTARAFGDRYGTDSRGFFLSTSGGSSGLCYFNFGDASRSGSGTPAWPLTRMTILLDSQGYILNDTRKTWSNPGTGANFTTPDTMGIFNARNDGSWGTGMAMKLYDIVIQKNGVDVFHGVPCYRKADNVAGIYDVVGRAFLTNSSGSGAFTVGGDI